ncbi:MAG TPA: glycosyltransferase [Myxococcaceae bacterium]|nr:glycosyltransferase [Myxococcaceae bacterium]
MKPDAPKPAKRIAYIVSRFPVITETFILYEMLELERRGIRVEVFSLLRQREEVMHREARDLVRRAHYGQLRSIPLLIANLRWLLRRPSAYLRAWFQAIKGNWGSWGFLARAVFVVMQSAWFAEVMEKSNVDHIHAHWATHPTLAAYVIRRLTGLRYSFTTHAHDIYIERPMLAEKIREASFVVTISEFNRQLLRRLYGKLASDKTVIVRCGVDPTVFLPPQRALRSGAEILTIVCVASLQDYKGHRYLIEACGQLRERGVPFRCLLVGEGRNRPAIEAQIARLKLCDQVTLLGRQSRDRVSQVLANSDALAMPSVVTGNGMMDGIPIALIEALATELPVVATAISGIPELVEDGRTGLLVRQRDAGALAEALIRLYENPNLGRRLARAGRERVLRDFNLKRNVSRLCQLFAQDWSDKELKAPQLENLLEPPRAESV